MIRHYVSIFDSQFLPQGLSLARSISCHDKQSRLWVFCLDEACFDRLNAISLPHVTALRVADFETDELRKLKDERSAGEYCWTLTPFLPDFLFQQNPEIERAIYIDADMIFLRDPTPIFDAFETSGQDIMFTEHCFDADNKYLLSRGRFCVQFMIFDKIKSKAFRGWWQDKCVEWCFAKLEDGKFGDQLYLNDWYNMHPETVFIPKIADWFMAPWNANSLSHKKAILWHFHSFRITKTHCQLFAGYRMPKDIKDDIYAPYFKDIVELIDQFDLPKSQPVKPKYQDYLRQVMWYFRTDLPSLRWPQNRILNQTYPDSQL